MKPTTPVWTYTPWLEGPQSQKSTVLDVKDSEFYDGTVDSC